ncbi:histidine kinase [Pseudoflavitalea sp. X16]|uniref:sensor histidine kinase n=1 Tax=Paraflavitalea devenefica TaxID=2716334 RepID=UPI00141E771F|nr:histidine kinase [Paraflavitalea devenefica]NII26390.1 histidine kinase [Paraflavitalea devenefica]
MKRIALVMIHIVGWLIILALVLIPLIRFGIKQPIPYVTTAYFLYMGSFYLNLLVIFPWWVKKRRIAHLLLSWLILIILYTALFLLVNYLFNVYQYQPPWLTLLNTFTRSVIFTGYFLLASTVYKFTVDWFRSARMREQQENQHLRTELAFLRSQINPHFLFNTLNNIYTLAYQQSDKTADAVMRLSGMMQYMLYESNVERVALQKELDYIDQLIALQQLRMKDRMALEYTVTGNTGACTIPPLVLIPFVENIFKHGVLNNEEDPAMIRLQIDNGQLSFHTRNRINDHLKDATSGIGLANVKRRIALLYPPASGFTIEQNGTHYCVHLTLQLH